MQKYRFVFGIIITLFLFATLGTQESSVYHLYTTQQFTAIESQMETGQIKEEKWRKFAEILFLEDLDQVLSRYISLYNEFDDEQLHKVIIDRISQYYYARGLYDSADRILKDTEFRKRIFSINTEKISFGVQLGAFSTMENAKNAKNKYSKNIDDIKIITKKSGGKELFVIITGSFNLRSDAENLRKSIIDKYGYSGMVIQY